MKNSLAAILVARRWVLLIALAALIFAVVAAISLFSEPNNQEFVYVKRDTIVQEVSVTGRVKAVSRAELGLEKSGRISWISAKVGGAVVLGQSLLSIDNGDLISNLEQAKASLKKEEVKLSELKRGTRPEEILVQQSKVTSNRVAVEDSLKALFDSLVGAYTKSDDSVRNKTDQFFSNPRSSDAQLNFTLADSDLKNEIESSRHAIESLLVDWEKMVRTLAIDSGLKVATDLTKSNLDSVVLFLEKVGYAVNSLTSTTLLSQTTIDTYKSSIYTARTNMTTVISELTSAEEKWRAALASLNVAEKELELKQAGNTAENILAQEATVEYAKAEVGVINAQISKTIIRAPFSGVVVRQDGRVGEILTANTPIITLISAGKFNIEANIPEADIAKINIGDVAKVTLDAYGGDINFAAKISLIEPGETIIDGVPTYKVTFEFIIQDERIRSGMTANIDILISTKDSVLVIPQKAVTGKNGERVARVLRGGDLVDVKIKTGLRGESGNVEVIDGLSEGEAVLLPTE